MGDPGAGRAAGAAGAPGEASAGDPVSTDPGLTGPPRTMSACRRFRAWYAADVAASSVDAGMSPGSGRLKPAGTAQASSVTSSARGTTSASRGSASMTPSGARGDRGTPTMRT